VNVFIILEDFRKDQYVVAPIVKRMLAETGKPNANVRVCFDPSFGGIAEAMKWERIKEVLDRYRGMVDVFLLVVDRDGKAGRRKALHGLERKAAAELGTQKVLFAENAWQEIEVWALAGQRLPKGWQWRQIRSERHPKERYFEPLAARRGLTDEPGQGRKTMGLEAAANYRRVRSRCPEDVKSL
jgi:hypothetical protein